MRKDQEVRQKRYDVYWLLAILSISLVAGRIAVFHNATEDTAFGSANDRSRWCTVAALVEDGTYAIDKQIAIEGTNPKNRRPWDTIDKVRHIGRDGKQHYYSSKPPLFATLVAGVYAVVRFVTGLNLTEHPVYVARLVLACVNLPLLGLFFFSTIASVDHLCRSEWARIMAAATTCFGVLLIPFALTLNNHLPAAAATALTMWVFITASEKLTNSVDNMVAPIPVYLWILAGFSAAFAVANELPALSMFAFWLVLFWFLEKSSVLWFLGGAAVVAVAFFGTNWAAHQSLRPPYAHRGEGNYIAELNSPIRPPDESLQEEVRMALVTRALAGYETEIAITASDEPDRWVVRVEEQLYSLVVRDRKWKLNTWDDWYEYPGTYWKEGVRQGVDKGEPSRLIYFMQMTIGHHGIFSLTPIWLLLPIGIVTGLRFGPPDYRRLNWAVLIATLTCILFYVFRPLVDRNYGGVSIGFRWLLWFTPLWIVMITPIIEDFAGSEFAGTRKWRWGVYLLLALSVFSVSVSLETPWEHPWIYRFWEFLGWIEH
jgi:hypothetical protein